MSQPTADTMTKVVIHRAGSYARLKLEQTPKPALAAGQVRIAVRATGVNYADCMVRMGLYSSAKELVGWPITPGFEVAGTVEALGEGAGAGLAVGDRVFGVTLFNGYASHVAVPRAQVFPIADGVTFEQAAAMPAVFMTAWFALIELANLKRGRRVLVHSAAGGVGGSLVQIAKHLGCHVVGVVGASHKVDAARSFGCDVVVDKSKEPLWPTVDRHQPGGFDVVCDANGVATLGDSFARVRPAGRLVVYGFHTMIPKRGGKPNWLKLIRDFLRTPRFNPLDLTQSSRSVLAFNLSYLFDRIDLLHEAMADIAGWLAEGAIVPPPVTTYPLADVGRAHADIESAQTVGKLVLLP